MEGNPMEGAMRATLFFVLAILPVSALAQVGTIPSTSPSENTVNSINRSLQQNQRFQQQQQQNQFEINQLRSRQQEIQTMPTMTGPNVNYGCAPGTVCR
jgi:hypothetical protein